MNSSKSTLAHEWVFEAELKNAVVRMVREGTESEIVLDVVTRTLKKVLGEADDVKIRGEMDKSALMGRLVGSLGTPVWTEAHIDELLKDFHVVPRD